MGCPVECPRVNGKVCGDKGACYFPGGDEGGEDDDDKGIGDRGLQCLCQDGYYGNACQYSGYLAGIILITWASAPTWLFFLLIGFFSSSFFFFNFFSSLLSFNSSPTLLPHI